MKTAKKFIIILSAACSVLLANNAVANSQHNDVQLDKCVLNPTTADCQKKYEEQRKKAKDNKEPAKATRA